jgi:NADH-quinone oxidoreductase subunit N
VTAFLAVGSKAAGFVLLLRVLFGAWQPAYANGGKLALLVGSLAGLTLLYGNLAAIPQRNIKRLLGYSSIGHAGYMLMGLAAVNEIGVSAVLYYLSAYLFTTLCAFMVIVAFSSATGSDDIPSYSGLAKRSPILALAMLLAMLSLAGIPPLAGFIGKFLLFTAVVDAARTQPQLYVLAFIGIAMAVVSLYFYLGVAKAMYLQEPDDETPIPVSLPMRAALYVAMGGIFVLGMFQRPVMDWAQHAAAVLGVR